MIGGMKIDDLLAHVLPNAAACREAAEKLKQAHPGMDAHALAQRACSEAQLRGAAAGAATGAAASPLLMIPAALADMVVMLRIEGMLAGVIGALLDPASLDDAKTLRADVIA